MSEVVVKSVEPNGCVEGKSNSLKFTKHKNWSFNLPVFLIVATLSGTHSGFGSCSHLVVVAVFSDHVLSVLDQVGG